MNRIKAFIKNKKKAQAMVEFALVLPILLTLVYGLIEVGRLIFFYSAATSAARQAVRYGSATGYAPDGVTFRYNDCAGIVNEAVRMGFIANIQTADVIISYDEGPDSAGNPINEQVGCPPAGVGSGNRIRVTVTARFNWIIPVFPDIQRLRQGNEGGTCPADVNICVTSSSARTIIGQVSVAGTVQIPPTTSGRLPTRTSTPLPSPTPCPAITGAPTLSGSLIAGDKVNLSWTAVTNATLYQVYVSSNGGVSYSTLGSLTSQTFVNNIETITNAIHYYKVLPANNCGNGPTFSNVITLSNGNTATPTRTFTPSNTPTKTSTPTITGTPTPITPTNTPTITNTPMVCPINASTMGFGTKSFYFTLTNANSAGMPPTTISSLTVTTYMSAPVGQALNTLASSVNGGASTTIWNTTTSTSPYTISTFIGAITDRQITSGNGTLKLTFNMQKNVGGSTTNYIVTINFAEAGCDPITVRGQ